MKKHFKTIVALAAATTMTMSPVLLAHADEMNTVMETPYTMTVNGFAVDGFRHMFFSTVYESTNLGAINIVAKPMSADEYFTSVEQEALKYANESWYFPPTIRTDFAANTPEGYEWHFLTGDYRSFDMMNNNADCDWWYYYDITGAKDWIDITFDSPEVYSIYNLTLNKKFTVNVDGVDYPECRTLMDTACDDVGMWSIDFAVLLPQNFHGNLNIRFHGGKPVDNQVVMDETPGVIYQLLKETDAVQQTASVWKQDNRGWWVENPDGTYLKDEWYQSPSSGLWYYLGSDGYMLTNTTTPDGLTVNADGVWVQ